MQIVVAQQGLLCLSGGEESLPQIRRKKASQ
jgi:hypothetical protein